MTVLDLIIKLQQLPPNAKVMIDQTTEDMDMFKFVAPAFVDEVELEEYDQIVVISTNDLESMGDEEDEETPSYHN